LQIRQQDKQVPEEIVIDGLTLDHNNGITLRLDNTTKKVDIRNCVGTGDITIFKMASDGVYRVWKKVPDRSRDSLTNHLFSGLPEGFSAERIKSASFFIWILRIIKISYRA
jgi:hypothetical protein